MTEPQPASSWTAPPGEPGPAPGVEFAPHGPRLVAYLLDGILLGFVITVIAVVAALAFFPDLPRFERVDQIDPVTAGRLVAFVTVLVVLILAVTIAYFPWFWARGGQTPGMRPFSLYVVNDRDGGPITGSTALLRLLGFWVSGAVFSIGFIWILIDPRRRGWHDLIAGTLVVKR